MKENVQVRGHGLRYDGRVMGASGSVYGEPRAICECGERSPVLPTTTARQRWHRDEHRPAVRRAMTKEKA